MNFMEDIFQVRSSIEILVNDIKIYTIDYIPRETYITQSKNRKSSYRLVECFIVCTLWPRQPTAPI